MVRVSTQDIANKLNLSRNTVSKALNDNPEVTEKTKKLVIETAIQMGYKRISRQDLLETQDSGFNKDICLLVHEREMGNSYWNTILKGAEEFLTAQKYRIVLAILTENDEISNQLPPTLQNSTVAGIITIGTYSKNYYKRLKATDIPLVTIDTAADVRSNNLICDTIMACNHSTVFDITERLIQNGYRKIAFAGNPDVCRSIRERWNGFWEAMQTYGLEIFDEYKVFRNINIYLETLDDYFEDTVSLPEAIVCANDNVANKIRKVLKAKGIQIPGDIAISGFDDYDTGIEEPKLLTSVNYNIEELGSLAARQILYRIEKPDASLVLVRLTSTVIYRQSTESKNNLT